MWGERGEAVCKIWSRLTLYRTALPVCLLISFKRRKYCTWCRLLKKSIIPETKYKYFHLLYCLYVKCCYMQLLL